MDKFKAFLKEKKVNKHFKRSGPGATLGASTDLLNRPSAVLGSAQADSPNCVDRVLASDIAAQAALKRLYKEEPKLSSSQKKIQMIAQRELEKERGHDILEEGLTNAELSSEIAKMGITPANQPDIQELEHSDLIKGVFYTCDLLGDDVPMTKNELTNVIEEFLTEQLNDESQDRIIPAVLMLYSMNKRDVRQLAIEVIGKYIQNIAENPNEPKFRSIRLSNKIFQERVQTTKGGRAFLEAVGFRESMQSLKEGDHIEPFLVMDDSSAQDVVRLVGALEALREGQCIPLKLSRDTKVYFLRENERVPLPKLPDDFYELTTSEVKAMQQNLTAQVDRITQMRTREMRQRDELQCRRKYKYTLIRIRFPDRYVLQGTFGCHETLLAVRHWVHGYLMDQATEFALRDPVSGNDLDVDSKTLSDLQLAPTAILYYESKEGVTETFLKEEHIREAMPFTVL